MFIIYKVWDLRVNLPKFFYKKFIQNIHHFHCIWLESSSPPKFFAHLIFLTVDGKNVSKSTSLLAFTVGCEQSFLSGEVRRFAQGIRGDSQSSARHPSINFLFRKFFFLLFDSRDELHKKEGQLVIFIHGISLYLIR